MTEQRDEQRDERMPEPTDRDGDTRGATDRDGETHGATDRDAGPDAAHRRPEGLDDATVEALGKLSEALEVVEQVVFVERSILIKNISKYFSCNAL